jgi:hypothetical protein
MPGLYPHASRLPQQVAETGHRQRRLMTDPNLHLFPLGTLILAGESLA